MALLVGSRPSEALKVLLGTLAPQDQLILARLGASQDDWNEALAMAASHRNPSILHEEQSNATVCVVNVLDRATSEFVLFLRSDSIPDTEWLQRYRRCLERPPSDRIGAVAGPIIRSNRTPPSGRLQTEMATLLPINAVPSLANIAIHRSRALKLRGIERNTSAPSPLEFVRWFDLFGFEVWWLPDATVNQNPNDSSPRFIWSRGLQEGTSQRYLCKTRLAKARGRKVMIRNLLIFPFHAAFLAAASVVALGFARKHWFNLLCFDLARISAFTFRLPRQAADVRIQPSSEPFHQLLPPKGDTDELSDFISKLCENEPLNNVLDVGPSSSRTIIDAFIHGLDRNPHKPKLFCLEISPPRFAELQKTCQRYPFVYCYNASSIPAREIMTPSAITEFYNQDRSLVRQLSMSDALKQRDQNSEYLSSTAVPSKGISLIKERHQIRNFDMVFIDGSAFTGSAELRSVYGATLIVLNHINDVKNSQNYQELVADRDYRLIAENRTLGHGYAAFKKIQPDTYASFEMQIQQIEGFMVPGQEEFLFNKVKSLKEDAVILEIGSFKGRSTVTMGCACLNTDRRIYCIDTWDGNQSDFAERNFFATWERNVMGNGVMSFVTPLRGFSHEVLKRWDDLAGGRQIDFAFIDGSHEYSDVLKDFEMVYPLVRPGGWIAFHDVVETWPGPLRVWKENASRILANCQFSSTLACGQKLIAD